MARTELAPTWPGLVAAAAATYITFQFMFGEIKSDAKNFEPGGLQLHPANRFRPRPGQEQSNRRVKNYHQR